MKTIQKLVSFSILSTALSGSLLDKKVYGELEPPKNQREIDKGDTKPVRLPFPKNPNIFPIPLTQEGKKWMEVQKDIYQKTINKKDGGLIDASTFLSGANKKLLNVLVGGKGEIGGIKFEFVKLEPKENGYQYAMDVDYNQGKKERWYISASPYYRDQFPNDIPRFMHAIAIWKKTENGGVDKLTQHELKYYKIISVNGRINFDYLSSMIEEAKECRKSELIDRAKIKDFDLPKNTPIGYIGLADLNLHNDPVLYGIVEDVGFFPELMNKAGYNFVINKKGKNLIQVNSNPKELIEKEVEAFRKNGVKNIYLKLSSHGNESGTYFVNKEGYNIFTPGDLIDILNKFQDCKFTVSTDACQNGGLSEAVKGYKDPAGKVDRVHLFVQSKISGYNQEGRLKGTVGHADIQSLQIPFGFVRVPAIFKANIAPKVTSSYYNVFFYNYILNSEPYGKAHLKADEDVKKIIPCDAGAVKSTPDGGITTSMLTPEVPIELPIIHVNPSKHT